VGGDDWVALFVEFGPVVERTPIAAEAITFGSWK